MTRARVLVAEDKPHLLDLVAGILEEAYDVSKAPDGAVALSLLESERFDVVVTDVRMPHADGFQVLAAARRISPETQVVMLTAYASVPDAVAAMREGAYDYVEKPFDPDNLALVVARALEQRRRPEAQRPMLGAGAGGVGGAEERARRGFREAVEAARDRASLDYLVRLMRDFDGSVSRAAKEAGLARESLHRVLRRYGLRPEDFRKPEPR